MTGELDKAREALDKRFGVMDSATEAIEALVRAILAEQGGSGKVVTPASVEELDRLLNSEDDIPITIMPDGSIGNMPVQAGSGALKAPASEQGEGALLVLIEDYLDTNIRAGRTSGKYLASVIWPHIKKALRFSRRES